MVECFLIIMVARCWSFTCGLYRLSAYGCLSTGLDEGLIEIVTPASTIAKIQLENPGISKVQSAFNKLCIYQWLQKHNSSKQRHVHTHTHTHTTVLAGIFLGYLFYF